MNLIKRYWDIISGVAAGISLAVIAEFELERVQLYYSIIILILVSIGALRIVKQAVEKQRNKKERKRNMIDSMVDGQKSIKAISLAQSPTKEGEKLGEFIIILWEVSRRTMNKLKEFFDKFKGIMLTIALAILTIVEMCGGFINTLFDGALTIKGIEVLPLVTLAAVTVIGIISNGYTTEQKEKIKALFSKSSTNELVKKEIKKSISTKSTQLAQLNKTLAMKEHEHANLNSELESLNNTLQAKWKMYQMTPQLATDEDIKLAQNAASECESKINNVSAEIDELNTTIENLTTAINALKSQA